MVRDRLHNRVRERRRAASGMTQEELAGRVKVTRQSIISIERGRYRPGVALALRLARALECRVEDLFELPEDEREHDGGPGGP